MSDAEPQPVEVGSPPPETTPAVASPLSSEGLRARFGDAALSILEFRGELTLVVSAERIVDVCRRLRNDPEYGFNVCMDVSATDHLTRQPRFDVNYHLCAIPAGTRLRVKVMLPGNDPGVETVTAVWPAANWYEREIYDLMGIVFLHHPDLRRIELPEEWVGHPHRRDYPVGKYAVTFTPPPPGQTPGT